jgi:hypothetical protein
MDWADPLVLVTGALLLVTGVYVFLTGRLANQAARTADAAERTLLLDSMPIVLPAPGGSREVDGMVVLEIGLRNDGRQPALNVTVQLRADGYSIGPIPTEPLQTGGDARNISLPGQPRPFPQWNDFQEHRVRVEYRDAVGNHYRVERTGTSQPPGAVVNIFRSVAGKWEPLLLAHGRVEVSAAWLEVPSPPKPPAEERDTG